jgi:molecular chaperone GrpE (heat shock protein)
MKKGGEKRRRSDVGDIEKEGKKKKVGSSWMTESASKLLHNTDAWEKIHEKRDEVKEIMEDMMQKTEDFNEYRRMVDDYVRKMKALIDSMERKMVSDGIQAVRKKGGGGRKSV